MKNLNSKKILVISGIIFSILFIISVILFFYLNILSSQVVDLKKDSESVQSENVFEMRLQLNKISSDVQKINNYLVSKDNVAVFLDNLNFLGEQNGLEVEIQDVNLQDITKGKDGKGDRTHGELKVSFRTQGSWTSIIGFIISIENLDKKVIIETIRLNASFDQETGSNTWTVNGILKVITD